MPAIWTEDNTIGNALSQIGNAYGRGPQMYKLGVETRTLLDQQQAADDYIRAQTERIRQQAPPPYMPPSPTGIPWEGPPSPAMQQERGMFDKNREAAIATMSLGARNPANMLTIAKGSAAQQALGDLSMYGVPTTPQGILQQDVQMRGHYPETLLAPKDQFTESKLQERYFGIQNKVARGQPLSPDEATFAEYMYEKSNPVKTKTEAGQIMEGRDRPPSAIEANMLAEIARNRARQAGEQPAQGQPLPPAPQAAAPGGPGSVVTVGSGTAPSPSPLSPSTPTPQTSPTSASPPPPPPNRITTAGGNQISMTPMPGGNVTHEQRRAVSAALQARSAREQMEPIIGVDPSTGKINPANYYVPNIASAQIAQSYGTNLFGQRAAQIAEGVYENRGDKPGVQEYYNIARQWIEPVIRYASGAAIPPTEFQNYFTQFIPNANDRPEMVQQKIEAMRAWEVATAKASSPAEAQAIMVQIAGNNPVAMASVQSMRVLATQHGTLNTPYSQLGGGDPGAPAPGQQAPAAAAATSAVAAPAARGRYDDVDRILGLR